MVATILTGATYSSYISIGIFILLSGAMPIFSKYSMMLFTVSVITIIVFNKNQREILKKNIKFDRRTKLLSILYTLFLLCLIPSIVFSSNYQLGIKTWLSMGLYLIAFYVGRFYNLARKNELYNYIIILIAISLLMVSLDMIYVVLKGAPRAAAFELDCIYSASYIGLLLPYLWVFGIETQLLPRFVGLLCLLSSVISAIALVLTLSRGALLATVLVLILYMFFKLPTKPKQVLMTLLFLLFILALIFTIPHAVERINISGMVQERSSIQSIEERYRLWHSSIKMFLDYPAFGIGFGQFQNMYSTTYALPEAINKSLTVAHNNFLQFLSETGLVGFTGFLSLTGYCLYSFVKLTQRTCQNPWCLSALLMTCSFVFFHGLTDSTFLFSPVGRLYWFLMGISYCQIHLLNIE